MFTYVCRTANTGRFCRCEAINEFCDLPPFVVPFWPFDDEPFRFVACNFCFFTCCWAGLTAPIDENFRFRTKLFNTDFVDEPFLLVNAYLESIFSELFYIKFQSENTFSSTGFRIKTKHAEKCTTSYRIENFFISQRRK